MNLDLDIDRMIDSIFTSERVAPIVDFALNEMFWLLISCVMLVVAVLIDLETGTRKARVLGEKIHSKGLRKSFVKTKDYLSLIYFGIVIDVCLSVLWKPIPAGVVLMTAIACGVECFSVQENLRQMRSGATKVTDIAEKIIHASSYKEAIEVIKALKELKEN